MIAAAMMAMLMQAGAGRQAAPSVNPPAASLARPPAPTGNPGTWVTNADYPPEAFHAGQQGVVGIQLVINLQGRVELCAITSSSGTSSLDEATCRLLQERAHFRPARDEQGNVVAGNWGGRVRWALPASLPAPVAEHQQPR
jgi:protein TonB